MVRLWAFFLNVFLSAFFVVRPHIDFKKIYLKKKKKKHEQPQQKP
jgi:hypothetical protein